MNTLSNDNNELRSRIDDLARNLENLVALVQQQQGLADTQLISGTHSSEEVDMSAPLQQLLLHRNKRKANKERHKNKNRKKRCKDGEQKQSRVQRTADGFYPHFELKGSGVSASGVFTWNGSVPSTGFRTIQYFGYIKEVQILYPGMYRIHAKVAINGRDYGNRRPSVLEPLISPAVGISLMKTNSTSSSPEVLDTTWKTQDDRGVSRYTSRYAVEPTDNTPSKVYPLDTIEVSGQFYLEQNDVIYLQRLQDMLTDPHFERFLNTNQHARFEMHKLPG